MSTSNPKVRVLRVLYRGIYDDYIEVEIPMSPDGGEPKKEVKVFLRPVGGVEQGKRVAKMKQSPAASVPPCVHHGYLPLGLEEEIRLQLGVMS